MVLFTLKYMFGRFQCCVHVYTGAAVRYWELTGCYGCAACPPRHDPAMPVWVWAGSSCRTVSFYQSISEVILMPVVYLMTANEARKVGPALSDAALEAARTGNSWSVAEVVARVAPDAERVVREFGAQEAFAVPFTCTLCEAPVDDDGDCTAVPDHSRMTQRALAVPAVAAPEDEPR